MTEKEFDKLVQQRLDNIKKTLIIKGREYRRNNDPLHNFKQAGRVLNTTPSKALLGFFTKHLVSIMDLVEDNANEKLINHTQLEEKIGDAINYLILLEAQLKSNV